MSIKIGKGQIKNAKYNGPIAPVQMHEMEDFSFNIRFPDCETNEQIDLICLIDGKKGLDIAIYLKELIYSDFISLLSFHNSSDEKIKNEISNFLINADEQFFKTQMGVKIARRDYLRQCILKDESIDKISELEQLDKIFRCSCSIVLAVLFKEKLFVANVGPSQAVLCGENYNQPIQLLTVDHSLMNQDELQRLFRCGVSAEACRILSEDGLSHHTRCLGDYTMKKEFRKFDYLCQVSSCPVIVEPAVIGPLQLSGDWRYLLLLSSGLCQLALVTSCQRDSEIFIASQFLQQLLCSDPKDSHNSNYLEKTASSTIRFFVTQYEKLMFTIAAPSCESDFGSPGCDQLQGNSCSGGDPRRLLSVKSEQPITDDHLWFQTEDGSPESSYIVVNPSAKEMLTKPLNRRFSQPAPSICSPGREKTNWDAGFQSPATAASQESMTVGLYEDLTLVAVQLTSVENKQSFNDGHSNLLNNSNIRNQLMEEIEMYTANSSSSSSTENTNRSEPLKAYVSFDDWLHAEKQIGAETLAQLTSLVNLRAVECIQEEEVDNLTLGRSATPASVLFS